jgi:hypothetical protein
MLDVFAVGVPLRASHPSAITVVPGAKSSLRHPRRYKELAVAVSNAQFTTCPSSPCTSM